MKYIDYWIPILKRQYFIFKLQNDPEAIIELEYNIWRNWNLTKEEKRNIAGKKVMIYGKKIIKNN